MAQKANGLDKPTLEAALRDALVSVVGSTGIGANPRVEFYNKFQREMEEHNRDFEKKYDEDLNTTLIFSGLFSAVTSAFIIDLQSELKPDYQEINSALLEMLLNATTGSLPAGSATPVPRWSGPDPVIVQVQSIFYTTLCATLLASFLAMLGKQWLNRYRQNETRGSTADRSRVRERKLTGIETWKFHIVMELLPLILQFALVLLGFALSRYLRELNRSVSSVVIGFTCFGFLFYLLIVTASIFSFNCPFQTPFSLVVRFVIGLTLPYLQNLRQTFGPEQRPPEPGIPGTRPDLRVDENHDLEANVAASGIAPTEIQPPELVAPLFFQETEAVADKLDARCISRMFVMSTGTDVVTSIMDFIPEIIWHSGIKDVPLRRIYGILTDCFDFTGPHPTMIPKLRDVAYLSARAFVHIPLQRRCITQYGEDKQESWKALYANHSPLLPTNCGADSDLETTLSMVDTALGCDNEFPWEKAQITPTHRAWMSHVFLYRVWHEGQSFSEAVMDFVENSMSLEPPSDVVITDCLFIIGLMVGVRFHVSDITVRDKSREKIPVLEKVFGALSEIYSKSTPTPLALCALRLVTRLAVKDIAFASYELFKVIVASDNLTDEYWEAARHAIHGAFQVNIDDPTFAPSVEEPIEILKFLDHHLGLQGVGEDHMFSINFALRATTQVGPNDQPAPLMVKGLRNFNFTSPPFVRGMRSIIHPDCTDRIRAHAVRFIALISDQWFNSTPPVMESEEMSEFCERLAVFMVDDGPRIPDTRKRFFILFGMLRSPEWRDRIVARLWSLLADWTLIEEEQESFQWCLQNAIELLEFTKRLPHGEGFKRWYGTLWFHFEKLDPAVRGEAESMARGMLSGDGLLNMNLYLNLIGREMKRMRRELDGLTEEGRLSSSGTKLRDRFIALEETRHQLTRIMCRQ